MPFPDRCVCFSMYKHVLLLHGILHVGVRIALDCDVIDVRGFCEDF